MAIQLGCNFSHPLLRLLSQGAASVEWIKLSRRDTLEEDLALARPVRPVLLHILEGAGRRPELWEGYPWPALEHRLAMAGSPHIAMHLETYADDWDEAMDVRQQSRAQAQAVLSRFAGALRRAQEHVCVPLLVENIPYHGSRGALRIVAQPEAIWQIVEETGAGLLLDTSHLRCTAYNQGVDVRAYARSLPLQAVREIHLSGPRLAGDLLVDRHYELQAEDYALFEWLLGHVQPAIVTLEYGGTGELFERAERNDPQALERQLREVGRLVGR